MAEEHPASLTPGFDHSGEVPNPSGEFMLGEDEIPPAQGPPLELETMQAAVDRADSAASPLSGKTPQRPTFDIDPHEDADEIAESVVSQLDNTVRRLDAIDDKQQRLTDHLTSIESRLSNLAAVIASIPKADNVSGKLAEELSTLHTKMSKLSAQVNEQATYDQKQRHLSEIKQATAQASADTSDKFAAETKDPPTELVTPGATVSEEKPAPRRRAKINV